MYKKKVQFFFNGDYRSRLTISCSGGVVPNTLPGIGQPCTSMMSGIPPGSWKPPQKKKARQIVAGIALQRTKWQPYPIPPHRRTPYNSPPETWEESWEESEELDNDSPYSNIPYNEFFY